MPQIFESPVKRFPGRVTLHEPLTLPMVIAYETTMLSARRTLQSAIDEDRGMSGSEYSHLLLPGIFPCVARFEIAGVPENPTPDTFPGAPRKAAAELIAWLVKVVTDAVNGEAVPEV